MEILLEKHSVKEKAGGIKNWLLKIGGGENCIIKRWGANEIEPEKTMGKLSGGRGVVVMTSIKPELCTHIIKLLAFAFDYSINE